MRINIFATGCSTGVSVLVLFGDRPWAAIPAIVSAVVNAFLVGLHIGFQDGERA